MHCVRIRAGSGCLIRGTVVFRRAMIFETGTRGGGALLVLTEPVTLIRIRQGLQAQADFSLSFIHADDLETHLIARDQRPGLRLSA